MFLMKSPPPRPESTIRPTIALHDPPQTRVEGEDQPIIWPSGTLTGCPKPLTTYPWPCLHLMTHRHLKPMKYHLINCWHDSSHLHPLCGVIHVLDCSFILSWSNTLIQSRMGFTGTHMKLTRECVDFSFYTLKFPLLIKFFNLSTKNLGELVRPISVVNFALLFKIGF